MTHDGGPPPRIGGRRLNARPDAEEYRRYVAAPSLLDPARMAEPAADESPPRTGLDVRDPLFWIACAAFASGACATSPWATALGASIVVIALRAVAGLRVPALVVVIAVFIGGGVRSRAHFREAVRTYDRAVELLPSPSRCFGQAIVVSSPVVRGGSGQADLDFDRAECNEHALDGPLRVRVHGVPPTLARGDRVEVAVTAAPVHLFRSEGTGDAYPGIGRSGVAASGGAESVELVSGGTGVRHAIDLARAHVRARIDATYHERARGLGRALVLGETDLDPGDDEAFRTTGLSHLLAVSGTHLVIAVLGLLAVVRAALVRVPALAERIVVDRWLALAAIPTAWLYGDFAGGSGSVSRAATMLSAAMAARALGRRPSSTRTVAMALLGQWLVDPLAIFDVSFTLSLGATIGLVTLARPIARVLGGEAPEGAGIARRMWASAATAFGTTLGASLACAPIIATMSPTLPIVGLVANLVAAPLGELVALPLCFAHALFGFSPALERGAAVICSGALLGVLGVARAGAWSGLVIGAPPPTTSELAILVGGFTAAAIARGRVRWLLASLTIVCIAGLEARARRELAPVGRLRVSALDVGQGDAILVDLPNGQVMLVDGGGLVGNPVDTGTRVVLPALRARRRSRIDVAVLSHPHPDHFLGLATTLDALPLGELWETGEADERGGGPPPLRRMIDTARSRGVAIRRPKDLCGAPRHFGSAVVRVLAPCPGIRDERGANDNSFVLRIELGHRAALLMGDAEHEEESSIVELDPALLAADLLKVGHHGSRTSTTPELLSLVAPRTAFISCGVRNRFGHPHAPTLQKLTAAGAQILRTDRGGEWRWETDGETVTVSRAVE